MNLYSLVVISGSIIFLLYFLSGIIYITRKPKIIINKKIIKAQTSYNITNINDYLNNIGKINIYVSIVFLLGFILAIYMDKIKCSVSGGTLLFSFITLNCVSEKAKKKYLLSKNTKNVNR